MCWYHPDTDRSVLCSKALWAAEFGVDRRRMDHWEKRLGAEDLERIRRGVIPLPARTPGPQGEERSYARAPEQAADRAAALGSKHPPEESSIVDGIRAALLLQLGLHACNSVIVTVGLHLPYPYTRRRATTRPAQFLRLLCDRMGYRGLTTAHH